MYDLNAVFQSAAEHFDVGGVFPKGTEIERLSYAYNAARAPGSEELDVTVGINPNRRPNTGVSR